VASPPNSSWTRADSATKSLRILDPLIASGGLVALTMLGFAVRLAGIEESLFGDELFTVYVTAGDDVSDVVSRVQAPDTEVSPPLFFLLAWLTRRIGNPDYVWIRVPSLILGTATIPLVYALGIRLVDKWAALVGTALFALLPFAVFYSTESRPYATLTFLIVLSTIALLSALQGQRRIWWVVYGLATCGSLYVHYTGVFVLAAQTCWALAMYRDRRLEVGVSTGAAALAYLPWLPSLSGKGIVSSVYVGQPTVDSVAEAMLRTFPGGPFVDLDAIPSTGALLVLGGVLGAAALVAGRTPTQWKELAGSSSFALMALLAVATPIGLLGYSFVSGNDIYLARNLSASLPAAVLLVALLLTWSRGWVGIALSFSALSAVAVGTLKTLDSDTQRPAIKQAARYIDAHAKPGEPVVDVAYHPSSSPLGRRLQLYFERPHRVYQAGDDDQPAWRTAADGRRVFLVAERVGLFERIPRRLGPGRQFVLRDQSPTYPGQARVFVLVYERLASGTPG
jgi:hypothetical protein